MVDAPPLPTEVHLAQTVIGKERVDTGDTAGQRVVRTAQVILHRYLSGDRQPIYRGVPFKGVSRRSRCQQAVRELLEAAVFGISGWREASCCAHNTEQKMRIAAKKGRYQIIWDIAALKPGDIVYLWGGPTCSRCGCGTGHAMVFTRKDQSGRYLMWQNTSYQNKRLCEIPLRDEQRSKFIAAYRLLDPKEPMNTNAIGMQVPRERLTTTRIAALSDLAKATDRLTLRFNMDVTCPP